MKTVRKLTCGCCTAGCVCFDHSAPKLGVMMQTCPAHEQEWICWPTHSGVTLHLELTKDPTPIGGVFPDGTLETPWDERMRLRGGIPINVNEEDMQ